MKKIKLMKLLDSCTNHTSNPNKHHEHTQLYSCTLNVSTSPYCFIYTLHLACQQTVIFQTYLTEHWHNFNTPAYLRFTKWRACWCLRVSFQSLGTHPNLALSLEMTSAPPVFLLCTTNGMLQGCCSKHISWYHNETDLKIRDSWDLGFLPWRIWIICSVGVWRHVAW